MTLLRRGIIRHAIRHHPIEQTKMAVTSKTVKAAGLPLPREQPRGMVADEFLYFSLRLRKGEVRRVKSLYPDGSPGQPARHLVNTQSVLSFVGGPILHLPRRVPVAGNVLRLAGFASGASAA
jgi:hypothetical protein